MNIELATKIIQKLANEWLLMPVEDMYFRAIGSPGEGGLITGLSPEELDRLRSARPGDSFSKEVTLPFLTLSEWCENPCIAPACNRRISRIWCGGQCIGSPCIFWGSEGIGTVNLER